MGGSGETGRLNEGGDIGHCCEILFRFKIGFRFISDSFQTGYLKDCKNLRFLIGSD